MARSNKEAEAYAAEQCERLKVVGLGPCACGDDLAGKCKKCEAALNITNDQIRDYVRAHRRDKWMDGGPGKGNVGDAEIVLFSTSTSSEGSARIRAEFARLINEDDGDDDYAWEREPDCNLYDNEVE